MFCQTGLIGRISNHGIAKKIQTSEEIEYFEDTYCEMNVELPNKR